MKDHQKNDQEFSRHEEESKSNASWWKTLLKKKWFFPAVYLAAAALILALITWYPNTDDYAIDPEELGYGVEEDGLNEALDGDMGDAVPVTGQSEDMIWPVSEDAGVEVVLSFFDDNATEEEQQAAMVHYNQQYHPSTGINLAHPDGEAFDVIAALSGTVLKAEKDPLVGYFVEIEHEDGLVTVYQSLANLEVEEGDVVKQGDLLGEAGRNEFEKDFGVHLRFEVRDNGSPVNPKEYLEVATE